MTFAAMAEFRARDEQATWEMAQREIARINAGQAPITGPVGMTALVGTLERMNAPSDATETLRATLAAAGSTPQEQAAAAEENTRAGIPRGVLVAGVVVLVLVIAGVAGIAIGGKA